MFPRKVVHAFLWLVVGGVAMMLGYVLGVAVAPKTGSPMGAILVLLAFIFAGYAVFAICSMMSMKCVISAGIDDAKGELARDLHTLVNIQTQMIDELRELRGASPHIGPTGRGSQRQAHHDDDGDEGLADLRPAPASAAMGAAPDGALAALSGAASPPPRSRPAAPQPAAADGKVRFQCPACNTKMSAARTHAGKRVNCRSCGTTTTIPLG